MPVDVAPPNPGRHLNLATPFHARAAEDAQKAPDERDDDESEAAAQAPGPASDFSESDSGPLDSSGELEDDPAAATKKIVKLVLMLIAAIVAGFAMIYQLNELSQAFVE